MAKNNNLTDFLTGVANALRTKKGTTALINPQNFESEIASISTGTDTSDATATAADILSDKTAYGASGKIIGTLGKQTKSVQIVTNKQTVIQPDAGKLLETVVVTTNVPTSSELTEIATASEMDALLVAANVGKAYKFTGTTDSKYINGDIYVVEATA